jgi:hypothetical protein
MKTRFRMLATSFGCSVLVAVCARYANAQILNPIQAHIPHSFVIGNTTLPPGDYTFRTMRDSELQLMTVTSSDDKTSVDFVVREAIDDHRPSHTEIMFRRYGNTDFLSKIFEEGTKTGVAVTETSRQEKRLVKEGQHGAEHSEEQK